MQSLAIEFESRAHLNEAVEQLWVGGRVTGEMAVRPLSGGRWRLDLTSEQPIRDKLLEKIPGKVLTGGAGKDGADETEAGGEAEAAEPEAAAADTP